MSASKVNFKPMLIPYIIISSVSFQYNPYNVWLVFWLTGHCMQLLSVCSVKLSVMSKVNPSERPTVCHT